jgi:phage regulator Rha-like protein
MKNEIVHTKNGEVFTSSKIIAEMLEVEHRDLLRTVKKIVARHKKQCADRRIKNSQKYIESSFTNKQGRTYKMYELNEQAYMKIAMQLSGYEKAEFVQDQIIEAFYIMKQALLNQQNQSWISKRDQGKLERKQETDVIKTFVDYATKQGSTEASRYYGNITKMTNKALELLIQSGHGKPLRDLATVTELGFIQVVDNRASEAIKDGMERELPYKEIYKFAKNEVETLVDNLCFKRLD